MTIEDACAIASLTDNEKIARWLGWQHDQESDCWMVPTRAGIFQCYDGLPRLTVELLLNVLVEKGYEPEMWHNALTKMWCIQIFFPTKKTKMCELFSSTIHEAITSAVLQVIESEAQDEMHKTRTTNDDGKAQR